MLVYPKILLQLWSDYHSTVIDISALVTAHLKRHPCVAPARADLRRAVNRDVEDEWAQQHVEAAAERLSGWCVDNGRYFCNVAVAQDLTEDDRTVARWPAPGVPERPWWQARLPWQTNIAPVAPKFEIIPFASKPHREFDLVLIDAPICRDMEAPERDFYLCDAPPFARRTDDARVPLMVSENVRKRLVAYAPDTADYLPFCRTLGIVRSGAREQVIQVLQVSVRSPSFPGIGWAADLISEARQVKASRAYSSDGDVNFRDWVKTYRAFVANPHGYTLPADAPQFKAPSAPDFAWVILNLRAGSESSPHAWVGGREAVRHENNPYRNAEGFWTALATILPAWRNYFPLTRLEVDALLREFDATYDETWRNSMKDLSASELFRFTPEVMDGIRARIDGLQGRAAAPVSLSSGQGFSI
jgi:hypothetical protein